MFSIYTLSVMNQTSQIIHHKFESIMARVQKMEQQPRKFGTDHLLTHAEIHLIEMIGDHENQSVTDIAALMHVTKGAVSQALKRLEKKELIAKTQDPDNLSRYRVSLSTKGSAAYWNHRLWHEKMDGGFRQYLDNMPSGETEIILTFLSRVEDFLSRILADPD